MGIPQCVYAGPRSCARNTKLLCSINATVKASNESIYAYGSIKSFNPFNLTWLELVNIRGSMELISPLDSGHRDKKKEPRSEKDTEIK